MDGRHAGLRGLSGVAGGLAWVVWVVLGERRPPCCAGGVENVFLSYEWWKLAAYLLIAVTAATVATGAAGRFSSVPRLGAALVAAGGVIGASGLAAEAAGLVLDRPFPEIAALIVFVPAGTVLLAAGTLRTNQLPRSVATALLLGGGLMYAGNGETRAMLLWTGLGFAWALCGAFLLSRSKTPLSSV